MRILFILFFSYFLNLKSQYLDVSPSSFLEKNSLVFSNMFSTLDQNSGLVLNKISNRVSNQYNSVFYKLLVNENIDFDSTSKINKRVWLISLKDSNFGIFINPIIGLSSSSNVSNYYNRNSRGVELRLNLFKKLTIHSDFTENQIFLTTASSKFIDTFNLTKGIGYYKKLKVNGLDYLLSNARICGNLISKNNSFIHFTFGHFQQKFGVGIHSLIAEGTYKSSLGLRLFSKLGNRIIYTNYWSQMHGFTPILGNTVFPIKYLSIHRIGFKFLSDKTLEFGFSEMTIHSRNEGKGGFELEYLNPIILYRFVESNLGSADNSLIAFDLTYFIKSFTFYSQLVVDEFRKSDFNKKWWGNKFAYQLGIRHVKKININYGHILQLETNTVRPYMYSHFNRLNTYTNFNQPIGHFEGANFRDLVFNYTSFFSKLGIYSDLKFSYVVKGVDSFLNAKSMGSNPNISSDNRPRNYNVNLFQGIKTKVINLSLSVNKQIWHRFNFGIEVGAIKPRYNNKFETYLMGRLTYRMENFSPFL